MIHNLRDGVLVLGASLRLTRLVVADDLGQWWIKDPAMKALANSAHRHERVPKWGRYLDGLSCPFCVGQWIAFGVLGSYLLSRQTRAAGAWRFVAAGLTLNETAAHLGARLGDTASEE